MKRLGVDLVDITTCRPVVSSPMPPAMTVTTGRVGVFAGVIPPDMRRARLTFTFRRSPGAAFMTGLERNADVVPLATYAPLLAHVDAPSGGIDLIWFDSLRMMRTFTQYYVQQLYGMNPGNDVLPALAHGRKAGCRTGTTLCHSSAGCRDGW